MSRAACAVVCAVVVAACSRSPDGGLASPVDGAPMVRVPAMTFPMGTQESHPDLPKTPAAVAVHPWDALLARADAAWRLADEKPVHSVGLRAFAMDRTEVTNAQYRKFLRHVEETGDHRRCHPDEPKNKSHRPRYWGSFNPLLADRDYARTAPFGADTFTADDAPVVGVDWFDAFAYAAWAGKRLPTEAEWEAACRGPAGLRWPWGNDWAWGKANVGGERKGADVPARGLEKDGWIYPAPVGSFPLGRSPSGCDDLAGNAAEWVADRYQADAYSTHAAVDPQGPAQGEERVVRGGSSQSAPSQVRCAARASHEPEFRTFTLGFRTARDL